METSAACVTHLASSSSSSILFSPFTDQSHCNFYHHYRSLPSLSLRSSPSRSSNPPLRAICENAFSPPLLFEPASDQNSLLKELAELKLQMKQKKKELKCQKKDVKKKLKLQVKEEKKAMKQKDGTEGKKKKKCQSESSSSSSESSDEECDSVSMRMLRQERSLLCRSEDLPAITQLEGNTKTCCEGSFKGVSSTSLAEAARIPMDHAPAVSSGMSFNGEIAASSANRGTPVQEDALRPAPSSTMCCGLSSTISQAPNRIEVCAGGKCKKAGSEQLLMSICAQIPSSSDIVAVPCKCMGKCSMTMNVKVHKEDTNPQHHSHVRVGDANLILSHHFGLGRPSSGLPSLTSQDRTKEPLLIA